MTRKGLAPLELVLAMPLLMMVMALMVVFGHAAYWKVRGLSVTRNAAWSNRWPRTGFDEPTPRPWTPAQYTRRDKDNLQVLDDPSLKHPVVRGPLPNGFNVKEELLDFSRGMTEGHAEAKIDPAMMPTLEQFEYNLEQPLLDGKFQYPQMDIPSNVFRRIPFIYELPKAEAGVSQAWVSAALRVINAPFKPDLQPLDHDEEVFSYYGSYPDFHPRLARFCDVDVATAEAQTQQLIRRIRRLPQTMTNFWIRMYQSQIAQNPEQAGTLQPQIDLLQAFLAQLQQMDSDAMAGITAELRPIPAALLHVIGPRDTRCCGTELPIHEILDEPL